jgi:predicted metalloprotease
MRVHKRTEAIQTQVVTFRLLQSLERQDQYLWPALIKVRDMGLWIMRNSYVRKLALQQIGNQASIRCNIRRNQNLRTDFHMDSTSRRR